MKCINININEGVIKINKTIETIINPIIIPFYDVSLLFSISSFFII